MNLRATNQANPNQISKSMSPEQFTQIVDAILEGKYSWACVLILRFAGYNPLHYIPYRTYNRLAKENCQTLTTKGYKVKAGIPNNYSSELESKHRQRGLSEIKDLAYLEVLDKHHSKVNGCGSNYKKHLYKNAKELYLTKISHYEEKFFSIFN